jgi:hypothetical protein
MNDNDGDDHAADLTDCVKLDISACGFPVLSGKHGLETP